MKKSILMLLLAPVLATSQPESSSVFPEYFNNSSARATMFKEKPYETSSISKYAGHYKAELKPGFEITVFVEGGKLYGLKKGDSQKAEISPVSPEKFALKGDKTQIEFLEGDGEVLFMMFAKDEMVWLTKVK